MSGSAGILIVGGYGVVGRRIAADLAPDYPGRVVVAGRGLAPAGALAAAIGHGTRSRRVDVADPPSIADALDDIALVVSCIDQPEPPHLLRAAIARGLAYTDLSPHLMTRRPTEELRAEAARSGARVVLGAGLAPGISSVLARLGAERVGPPARVEISLLLSVGDAYGPASRGYLLEEIVSPYRIVVEGRERPVRPFSRPARAPFSPPIGPRTAYLFPFSDQVFFPQTLGVRTAISRLALDPPWLGSLVSALVRLNIIAAVRGRDGAQARTERLIVRLQDRYKGRDQYGVVVQVWGPGGVFQGSVIGRQQATGAAVGAAAIARALAEGEVARPGLWLAEEVVSPGPFFERLAARGLRLSSEVRPSPDASPGR